MPRYANLVKRPYSKCGDFVESISTLGTVHSYITALNVVIALGRLIGKPLYLGYRSSPFESGSGD